MPKKKSKGAFRDYTPEQIFAVEAVTFVIVAGSDFFDDDGNFFFSKGSAVRYYNKIRYSLLRQLQSSKKKDRTNAKRVLDNLRIEPMRIH